VAFISSTLIIFDGIARHIVVFLPENICMLNYIIFVQNDSGAKSRP